MKDLQPVSFGKEKYLYLSATKSHQLAFKLANSINQKIAKGEEKKPEIVIAIARGALAWTKTLADWLNVDQMTSFRVVHYTNVGKRLPKPTILESYLPRVDKKRILLFDNVVETGKTMKLAIDFLLMCGAEKVTTATLFYKKGSVITPNFYSLQTDAWIIFYFDILETIKLLGTRWLNQGLNLEEINRRFLTIGLPQKEAKLAMKIIFNFP